MKNGSGLNDTNRFSATQMTRILRYMYERFPLAPEYLSSVGIAGKDGTLKYRFEGSEAVGRLRAKTGTLENVSALSGYVQAAGGEKFVFSMMVNDYPGRSGPVVQRAGRAGRGGGGHGLTLGPSRAVAALADSARPGGALADGGQPHQDVPGAGQAARPAQHQLPAHGVAQRARPGGARRAGRQPLPVQPAATTWARARCSTATPPPATCTAG